MARCVDGRTKPKLWARVKREVTAGSKGGKRGQWSARKAQLAVQRYKKRGGGYCGKKTKAQKSLTKWTREDWGTKSGKRSLKTGERYLPRKAREALSDSEYRATSRKKRKDLKAGKQFSKQPKRTARKTAAFRGFPMSATERRQTYMQNLGAQYLAASEGLESGVYYNAAMHAYPDNVGIHHKPGEALYGKKWVKPAYLLGIAGLVGYFLMRK